MKTGIKSKLSAVAKAINAELRGGDVEFTGVQTDSREVNPDNLFLARKGEDSDGHSYISQAVKAGAVACIVEKQWINSNELNTPALVVEDSSQALFDLARFWREKLNCPVICITGSNGKTTTKELLAHVLAKVIGQGTASIKSFNNHVGLPLTILSASREDRWLVLEAGMNHSGELKVLGGVAKPDIAVVLNVAEAHRGYFNDVSEIADAKCELLSEVKSDGTILINTDNLELVKGFDRIKNKIPKTTAVLSFGGSEKSDFAFSDVKNEGFSGVSFSFRFRQGSYSVKVPLLGAHNAYNACACLALAHIAFSDQKLEKFCSALADATSASMRLQIEKVGTVSFVNDAYNANPESVKAAINAVASIAGKGNFGVVLGDMFELGSEAARLHQEIARHAVDNGCKFLIMLGDFAGDVVAEASSHGLKDSFACKEIDEVIKLLSGGEIQADLVLVKGSRAMAMERVIKEYKEKIERNN